jgi:DNA-binding CsgD family transcriptional regulator
VQLFVSRAQAVDPAFTLNDENAASIAAICRRLDGLPLAIELAAARTRLLSPFELLTRLDPALPFLTGGPDDAPDRLRTMRQAIAWSYDLLTEQEQALYRRPAIFVGGFTLGAAEAVGGRFAQGGEGGERGEEENDERSIPRAPAPPQVAHLQRPPPSGQRPPSPPSAVPPSVLDGIAALVDASLLRRREEGGQTRFEMLETIREFGLERLAECGEAEEIAARHATWCVDLADEVRRSGRLSNRQGLGLLEAEHPNLRAALAWYLERGKTTAALHLAGQLAEFWGRHSHQSEGRAWLERVLAADEAPSTAARAEALVGLNMMLWARSEWVQAAELLDEAETLARAAGDAGALAYARLHQGYVAVFSGNFDLAVARGEEALTTCEAIPQLFSCNGALWLLARTTLAQRENDRAAELYEQLLAASRAAGDEISVANCLIGQAILAERRGELARAMSGLTEAATVCRGFGDSLFVSHCLFGAAVIAVDNGRLEPAVRLFAAGEVVRVALGADLGQSLHVDWHRHEEAIATARAGLGTEGFAAVWAAGAALSLDDAIAELVSLASEMSSGERGHAAGPAGLTSREQEVLRLLILGWADKEIAAELGIGRRTVSSHVTTILGKLGVPSRTAAAAIAVRDRLV